MLKYVDVSVVFKEIPDEITLAISISNCPFHCKGCHSPYLAKDIGEPLTAIQLDTLIKNNSGITCVCFMGGDIAPDEVNELARHIRRHYPDLKIAWYSGAESITVFTEYQNFDYLKFGPYNKKLGGLDSPKTNQRLYQVVGYYLKDITHRFW